MQTLTNSILAGTVALLVAAFLVPSSALAYIQSDVYLSNIGNMYLGGYGSGMGGYGGGYGSYPSYGSGGYSNPQGGFTFRPASLAYAFDPLHDTFPTYQQQSYGGGYNSYYGNYGYGSGYGGNYGYPQMMYDPYFGASAAFGPAYPTGDYDFAGTPLCQWYDYNGRTPCAYDPHQWVYDQYTGTWY